MLTIGCKLHYPKKKKSVPHNSHEKQAETRLLTRQTN